MASVFTYDPDPPRVSSPWSKVRLGQVAPPLSNTRVGAGELGGLPVPNPTTLEDYGLAALEAEPQLGPVEYKLHLLLRPRQSFAYVSTDPGPDPGPARPLRSKPAQHGTIDAVASGGGVHRGDGLITSSTPSPQARQDRLRHLTTQLLWRLQQSSPYHASSASHLIVPTLPETSGAQLDPAVRPGKLLSGLEESQGAMYEIGVTDDGTFVGLTQAEMDESLTNLRAMAASLGCKVVVLRSVLVGSCQPLIWPTTSASAPAAGSNNGMMVSRKATRPDIEDLLVVEALVLPNTEVHPNGQLTGTLFERRAQAVGSPGHVIEKPAQETEQLRISLTGSTTSGKSSLLGSLLASTLDNARGKSRLSLLKHRHEIASGVTSSVAHELLGYQNLGDSVVNYACGNVESWTDVHDAAEGGRLVLLTDSAGHPRYRRTIVRSLIAWSPHWTLCCIAAYYDSGHGAASPSNLPGETGERLSPVQMLAIAHLELCLKLGLPLVVVITKYDLATKAGLKHILGHILTILKAAGRIPHLLRPGRPVESTDGLQTIPDAEMHEVRIVIEQMQDGYSRLVPIVLTSAVDGTGMTKVHALLRCLPIPSVCKEQDAEYHSLPENKSDASALEAVTTLFHVDEIFVKDNRLGPKGRYTEEAQHTFVLSGLLQRGLISVGDELFLGPFSDNPWPTVEPRPPLDIRRAASYPVTHHEIAMQRHAKLGRRRRSSEDLFDQHPDHSIFQEAGHEWYPVRVNSLRNLRLPVQTCSEGQAATVGVTFARANLPLSRPRKGMVLIRLAQGSALDLISACHAFKATFPLDDYAVMEPGSLFNVYVASIRALVKVVTVALPDTASTSNIVDDVFQLDGSTDQGSADGVGMTLEDHSALREIEVMFQLVNSREYIEVGTQVLVMPGQASEGSTGLDGYVGRVSEAFGQVK